MNISLVIPTCGRKQLLSHTLEGLITQMRAEDELVLCVDHATDGTREMVEVLCQSDQRIKLILPADRLTIYENWNLAISHTTHDCIIILNDDEIYNGFLLDTVRAEFEKDPGVVLVVGGQIRIEVQYDNRAIINVCFPERNVLEGKNWLKKHSENGIPFSCGCYMFKKRAKTLKWLRKNQLSADTLFLIAHALSGKVVELPFLTGTWLQHGSNTSRREYLAPNQITLSEGLEELSQETAEPLLQEYLVKQRERAYRTYVWNAYAAAAADGDRKGYLITLAGAEIAKPKRPITKVLRAIAANPVGWHLLVRMAKTTRFLFRLQKHFKKPKTALSKTEIAEKLFQSREFIQNFLVAAKNYSNLKK